MRRARVRFARPCEARRVALDRAVAAITLAVVVSPGRELGAQGDDASARRATIEAPVVRLRDVGPGASGRILRSVLAGPHATLAPRDSGATVVLRRDTTFATSVVVVRGNATVASTVHGDVVVVGGDLFLQPGAAIDGRAVAIGGGVYNSTLASVRGARLSFHDETFDATPTGGAVATSGGGERPAADILTLDFRALGARPPSAVTFPAYGVHLPSYDRVDGLSLPFGPLVALDSGRIDIHPTVTYRSHLGAVDLAARARLGLGRRTDVTLLAGRGTRTNDDWNRSDFLNGFTALVGGVDARNYYRADLLESRITRRWEAATFDVAPFVGARTERAWSAGPDSVTTSAPFSLFRRRDRRRGMLRPNPRVLPGRISSGVIGANANFTVQDVVAALGARVEVPVAAVAESRFVQTTLEGAIGFPAFGTQRLDFFAHAVVTAGDSAPPQRFAYLGGEDGTIVTRDLLSMGGDQLLYIQGLYSVPLDRVRIKFLGSPVLALRYAVGGAGVRRLPPFEQNVGLRLSLSFFRVQYMLDPATRDSRTCVSLSLFR